MPRTTDSLLLFMHCFGTSTMWPKISITCLHILTAGQINSPGKYYLDQEPTPETLSCRFCGLDMGRNQHIRPCEPNAMSKYILGALDRNQESPAPAKKLGVVGLDGAQDCAAKYKTTRDVNSGAHSTKSCFKRHSDAAGQFVCNDDAT